MIRWFFRLLTGIATLLFLACATIWVRGYMVSELWQKQESTRDGLTLIKHTTTLVFARGGVYFSRASDSYTAQSERDANKHAPGFASFNWKRKQLGDDVSAGTYFDATNLSTHLGFGYFEQDYSATRPYNKATAFLIPCATPTFFFLLFPFVGAYRILRAHANLGERKIIKSPEFADNNYLERTPQDFHGNPNPLL